MKKSALAGLLLLALAGCASSVRVVPPQIQCPAPPQVPAQLLEPEPSLIPLLDKLFSISAQE